MSQTKIILLAGNARTGKDTIADEVSKVLKDDGRSVVRGAFADAVKSELDDIAPGFLRTVGIRSAFSEDPQHKKVLRPMLVALGESRKEVEGCNYWADALVEHVIDVNHEVEYFVISDLRYAVEYKRINYLYGAENVCLIGVVRFDSEGQEIPPANEFEACEIPSIQDKAFHIFVNEDVPSDEREEYIAEVAAELHDIVKEYFQG